MAAGTAPNIRDVAELAGVSHQTVSRVINDHPSIQPQTRARVEAAIKTLGYRPNSAARSLARMRTGRIGAIVDSPEHFGPMNTLRGVEVASRRAGYFLSSVSVNDDSVDAINQSLEFLLDQNVEGLCLIAPRLPLLEGIRRRGLQIPSVVIATDTAHLVDDNGLQASVDQELGTRMMVDYLLELGHTRIAHLSGPHDWGDARSRRATFEATLAAHGLTPAAIVEGDWSPDSGFAAGPGLIEGTGATAVFSANDQMALGLVHYLSEVGLRVPDDVSVVGFDNTPESAHMIPPLTTVRQNFEKLGEMAIGSLLARIKGARVERETLRTQPSLVVRSSAGPRPATQRSR